MSFPRTSNSEVIKSIFRMYRNWVNNRRGGSSIESGPDLSFHCSLSTSPSVTAREFMYANYHSPDPSLQSFKFSFPLPSPDLRSIGEFPQRNLPECNTRSYSECCTKCSSYSQCPTFSSLVTLGWPPVTDVFSDFINRKTTGVLP